MVNADGAESLYDRSDQPTNVVSEPGVLVDRFGEEIGELAMIHRGVRLSRDASIGVTLSGRHNEPGCPVTMPRLCFACLLFPDGSFRETQIGYAGYSNFAISNDGSRIVVETEVPRISDLGEAYTGLVFLLDREGSIVARFPMADGIMGGAPAVSATGRYVACRQKLDTRKRGLPPRWGNWSTPLSIQRRRGRARLNVFSPTNSICASEVSIGQ